MKKLITYVRGAFGTFKRLLPHFVGIITKRIWTFLIHLQYREI